MITRRGLLTSATAAALIRPRPVVAQTTGVTPIFIKWDAWHDNTQIVTREFHEQLSPNRWQSRAPFFCDVLGSDRITCAGTQESVNIEIQAAAQAGIKAWMYVWYGPTGAGDVGSAALFKGWELHQSSPVKDQMKWCGDVGSANFGFNPWSNTAGWQTNCNLWANDYFKRSNYLKVGGRPVIFVPWQSSALTTHFAGSTANSITSFNYLRSQSIASGAGNPYIICIGDITNGTSPATAVPWIAGDAISAYVPWSALQYSTAMPETYATMISRTEQYWSSQQVATGKKTVPIALLGWDSRPRYELPGFSDGTSYWPWLGHERYYVRGTNTDIANHLQSCITFIGNNQPACDSKIMLVYAWNECTEGGTVGVPTLGDPPVGNPPSSALLTAIKPVLLGAA